MQRQGGLSQQGGQRLLRHGVGAGLIVFRLGLAGQSDARDRARWDGELPDPGLALVPPRARHEARGGTV